MNFSGLSRLRPTHRGIGNAVDQPAGAAGLDSPEPSGDVRIPTVTVGGQSVERCRVADIGERAGHPLQLETCFKRGVQDPGLAEARRTAQARYRQALGRIPGEND